MTQAIAGVDLGGTKIQTVVVSAGDVLGQSRHPTPNTNAAEVVAEIARRLPWLPNGSVGAAVAAAMVEIPDPPVSENAVPQSLTFALLRLNHEGLIELEVGDDPNRRTLLQFPNGETRGFSRVLRR